MNVISMKGAATKNGKFKGKVFRVNRGMMKGKLPIKICRSFRDDLTEKPKSRDAFPDRSIEIET